MKTNLVKKQVVKAQSNKHRKAKQVQLQDFQHKEGKLNVVGMTIRVGQGQSHLPADVPGITVMLGQRGRLQLKGQLRQQPASDFIIRGPSRRR
jgi:hypothetical protein